ncbi:unnamed protein product [Arctia plantaginis]|uniref:Osiris 9 n=1 Tax=Arctia plantaginis TaxID=874455 RepID=A0A8S0YTS4_ARCPL|nr:unnamed protein product [Arctia plantaginis]
MWKKIVFLAILAAVKCNPVQVKGVAENLVGAVSECIETDTSLCLKEKALKFTERLSLLKDVNIFEGMTLVNTGSARSSRSYEPLSDEPKARELQINERIADNVDDFLDNHVLQLRLSASDDESRSLDEEGRGKKKKKKLKKLLPLLLLLKLKFAALIPIFLGIIAIVAVKAVFLGKIAFAMSAFNLIRKLMSKKGGMSMGTSYGVPQQDDHPGYNYEPAPQGWGRKASDGAALAYSGHISD